MDVRNGPKSWQKEPLLIVGGVLVLFSPYLHVPFVRLLALVFSISQDAMIKTVIFNPCVFIGASLIVLSLARNRIRGVRVEKGELMRSTLHALTPAQICLLVSDGLGCIGSFIMLFDWLTVGRVLVMIWLALLPVAIVLAIVRKVKESKKQKTLREEERLKRLAEEEQRKKKQEEELKRKLAEEKQRNKEPETGLQRGRRELEQLKKNKEEEEKRRLLEEQRAAEEKAARNRVCCSVCGQSYPQSKINIVDDVFFCEACLAQQFKAGS